MALLTRLLLDAGVLDYAGVEEAIKAQVLYGGRIGSNLLFLKLVSEEELCKALQKCHGTPSVVLDEGMVEPKALDAIPEKFIRNYRVFPFYRRSRAVGLAMVEPRKGAIADISFSTGLIIKPFVTPEHRMDAMLEQFYGIPTPWRYTESYEEEVAPADVQAELSRPVPALPWDEADLRLQQAIRGKEIPNTILGFARRYFKRAVLFVVRGNELLSVGGFAEDDTLPEGMDIDLNDPSVFVDVVRERTTWRGKPVQRGVEDRLMEVLGGAYPASSFVAPVSLRGRVVNVLYGDNGPKRGVRGDMSDMVLFLSHAAQAYDRLVRDRLHQSLKESKANG